MIMDEGKWFLIVILIFIGFPMIGLGVEQYQRNQCRITAIQANMDPGKIAEVCK